MIVTVSEAQSKFVKPPFNPFGPGETGEVTVSLVPGNTGSPSPLLESSSAFKLDAEEATDIRLVLLWYSIGVWTHRGIRHVRAENALKINSHYVILNHRFLFYRD